VIRESPEPRRTSPEWQHAAFLALHVDMAETAARAGRTLLRALDGEVAPVIVWASRPLMTSTLEHTPSRQPMKDISVQSAGHQPHLPDEGARVTR
jgi:microcystin degradation protein MlrC